MKRLIREPLVHFLLLGVALYAASQWLPRDRVSGPGHIVVTQGRIEALAAGFARTWLRPPTGDELAGLVREYVREEVCAREAVALGLDRDDTVIRRRLRQKLEFVSEDLVARTEPTDDDLRAFLRAHPEAFRTEPQFTFRQVYLNPQRRGENLEQDAAQLLEELRQAEPNADLSALGDSVMLEHQFEALPPGEIAKVFGESFATAVNGLVPGQWQGPVQSGYGAHLVFISQRTEPGEPRLELVRHAVHREWANARREQAREQFYEQLLERYTVTIERPPPAQGTTLAEVRP